MFMKVFVSLAVVMSLVVTTGCGTENKNTAKGAGIGAAAGGVLGAIVGHQTGNGRAGALIGAAVGAGVGGLVGRRMDKQAAELEKIAETKRTEQGLITKLKSDILFDTGKSDLKPAAKTNLGQMAEILKKYPEDVLTVKGFTDSTGSTAVNQELSQRRADSVRSYLVGQGIPANTVSTVGMGEQNPIADNGTADGRKQNRRVEIEVTVDESKVPKKG
jgi:outer membrane protein OmpA-like peptidoglycan-associated protein